MRYLLLSFFVIFILNPDRVAANASSDLGNISRQITELQRQIDNTTDDAEKIRLNQQLENLYTQVSRTSANILDQNFEMPSESAVNEANLVMCGLDVPTTNLVNDGRQLATEIGQLSAEWQNANASRRIAIETAIAEKTARVEQLVNESNRRVQRAENEMHIQNQSFISDYKKVYKNQKKYSAINATVGAAIIALCCNPLGEMGCKAGMLAAILPEGRLATALGCVAGIGMMANGLRLRREMKDTGKKCEKLGGTKQCTQRTPGNTDVQCHPDPIRPCDIDATGENCACDPEQNTPDACTEFCQTTPRAIGCICHDEDSKECCLFQHPDDSIACYPHHCQSDASTTNCPCANSSSPECSIWCERHPQATAVRVPENPLLKVAEIGVKDTAVLMETA